MESDKDITGKLFLLEDQINLASQLLRNSDKLDIDFHNAYDTAKLLVEEIEQQDYSDWPSMLMDKKAALMEGFYDLSEEYRKWTPAESSKSDSSDLEIEPVVEQKSYYDFMFQESDEAVEDTPFIQDEPERALAVETEESEQYTKVEDLEKDVERLKNMFGEFSAAVHDQNERLDQIEDSVEATSHGNELVALEVRQEEGWAETLRKNKMLVGAIAFVSTAVVVIPTAAAILLKTKQKAPATDGDLDD